MPPQVGTPGRLAAAARCAHAQRQHRSVAATVPAQASATITTAATAAAPTSVRGTRRRPARATSPVASGAAGTFSPAATRRGTWRASFRRGLSCCNVNVTDHGSEPSLQINVPTSSLKLSKRPHRPFQFFSIHPHRPRSSVTHFQRSIQSPVLVAGFSTSSTSPLRAPSIATSSPHATFGLQRIVPRSRCPTCFLAMASVQKREHGGHSHSHGPGHHHHHHDNTYLVSANKNDPGVRITRIGLISNLGMAIAKFVGGYTFNSRAMTADAWHSIADLASDILTLATVSFSLKPPSERFPMGFGKVESLGSLGVSGMLLVGGLYMGWESALSLFGHFYPDMAHEILHHVGHGHSHSHGYSNLDIPSVHAAWLAGGTILVKEWLYRATMKVAKERKSSVLASNAIHHRVDSLTGIVTLAAILGANTLSNAAWLDPVGGLLISIMVINAGYGNTMEAFRELADQSIDTEVQTSVKKHALRALSDVTEGNEAELRDVTGVKSGQNYLVDLEFAVPGSWTIDDTRDVENAVRTMVGAKVRGVRRVKIRFVSKDADVNAKFDEFISGDVSPEPESETEEHDHDHKHHDHKH